MYVISLDHYLAAKGAIAIDKGPGRKIADFATAATAYASNRNRPGDARRPTCFKCRSPKDSAVDISITETGVVVWRCHACGSQGPDLQLAGHILGLEPRQSVEMNRRSSRRDCPREGVYGRRVEGGSRPLFCPRSSAGRSWRPHHEASHWLAPCTHQ
jgi:hypothetical protein